MTDKSRCGAHDPKNSICILDDGHKGMHFAGKGFHWNGDSRRANAKAKPAAPPKDDGQRCGVYDAKGRHACTQKQGHVGVHSSGAHMWKDAQPKKASKDEAPQSKPIDAVLAPPSGDSRCSSSNLNVWHEPARCSLSEGHAGDHEATVTVAEDWPEAGETRRIAWDKHGRGKGNDVIAKPSSAVPGPKILGYRRHPAAALFPLLEGEAFERFADRIKANGLRDPIVLVTLAGVDGETFILDGSNRGLACEARGVTPRFVRYEGSTDMDSLVAYSLDKNGEGRRHLDPSVRAMIAADAAKLGPGNPGDRETGRSAGLMTQAEAGKRLGVSERLVRRAVAVRDKGTAKVKEAVMKGKLAVEAAEAITKLPNAKQDELADEALAKKSGQVKSGRVRALVKQEEKRAVVRKINTAQVAPAPVGPYRLIVADFPWPYDNSDQHEGSRGHIPYPAMPVEQGIALAAELEKLADEDGCILAFWTTNAFMPDAVRMVEAWGFTWRTIFTWDKERDGIGTWGRGRTEHLILAERGEVEAHTLNEVSTLLSAPRREHSRKPDEMMALLEQHCPGPRLEMFAREPRKGWAVWGAETKKFAGAA